MSISFVGCSESWLAPLQEFFRRSYPPGYRLSTDDRLFAWQFREPAGRGYRFKLAVDGPDVRACLGYVAVDLSVAGSTVRAAWTANWMVDPSARRLGLGPLLMRQLSLDFDAVLAVGLAPDAAAILPRMGWVDFGHLPRYVFVLDADAASLLAGEGESKWTAVLGPPVRVDEPGLSRGFDDLDDGGLEELWDRVRGAGTKRTAAFLRWRYAEHPTFRYHLLRSEGSDGVIDGFAIYRIEEVWDHPITVARLVELVATPRAAGSLLSAVLHDAHDAGAALVDFFCSSRALGRPLLDAGFLPTTAAPLSDLPYLFQPIDRHRSGIRFMAHLRGLPQLEAAEDWYVTKGDGDQDRPN